MNEREMKRCEKCGGLLETIVHANRGKVKVPIPCECRKKAEEESQKRIRANQIMVEVRRLREIGILDERLKKVGFDSFVENEKNAKLLTIARNYVERFDKFYEDGRGIIFYGEVGTGKSYMAALIANELLKKLHPAIMTSSARITDCPMGPKFDTLLSESKKVDLLVLDDLGVEQTTDTALKKLWEIIDERYRAKKPLIITTNVSMQSMKEESDVRYQRIYDRIFEMCYPVKVEGQSWRKKTAGSEYYKTRGILEGKED